MLGMGLGPGRIVLAQAGEAPAPAPVVNPNLFEEPHAFGSSYWSRTGISSTSDYAAMPGLGGTKHILRVTLDQPVVAAGGIAFTPGESPGSWTSLAAGDSPEVVRQKVINTTFEEHIADHWDIYEDGQDIVFEAKVPGEMPGANWWVYAPEGTFDPPINAWDVNIPGEAPPFAAELIANNNFPRIVRNLQLEPNKVYTASAIMRPGTATVARVAPFTEDGTSYLATFDMEAGTILDSTDGATPHMIQLEDGWWLCGLTFTNSGGDSTNEFRIVNHAQGISGGWSGTGSSVIVWQAKVEEGDTPTSEFLP